MKRGILISLILGILLIIPLVSAELWWGEGPHGVEIGDRIMINDDLFVEITEVSWALSGDTMPEIFFKISDDQFSSLLEGEEKNYLIDIPESPDSLDIKLESVNKQELRVYVTVKSNYESACTDSDGLDYYTKGTVVDYNKKYEDSCWEGGQMSGHPVEESDKVKEYTCVEEHGMLSRVIVCLNGCKDGACIEEELCIGEEQKFSGTTDPNCCEGLKAVHITRFDGYCLKNSYCGDSYCEFGEICEEDCGEIIAFVEEEIEEDMCGDGYCSIGEETTCLEDCEGVKKYIIKDFSDEFEYVKSEMIKPIDKEYVIFYYVDFRSKRNDYQYRINFAEYKDEEKQKEYVRMYLDSRSIVSFAGNKVYDETLFRGQMIWISGNLIITIQGIDPNFMPNDIIKYYINIYPSDVILCDGCTLGKECLPFGYRTKTEGLRVYCSKNKKFAAQKEKNEICSNHYECDSNFCVEDKCVSRNIIQKIIAWFMKLFGKK